MSKKITLVMGRTGEYSDRNEWFVRAFADEAKAIEFCKELNSYVIGSSDWDYDTKKEFEHPLDPKCKIDYTGTDYTVFDIDFDDSKGEA